MDFAKKQLEKYGWKEGQGLGKEGNEGIAAALKPNYKTGKAGMGFDLAEELTDTWWTRAYDDCLKNVTVEKDAETGTTKVAGAKDDQKASKDAPHVRMNKRLMKANFQEFSKGGTLDDGKFVPDAESGNGEERPKEKKKKKLTDEELFKACGGRTAHKGARHGLKSSGKLARLAAQEAYLAAHPEKLKATVM